MGRQAIYKKTIKENTKKAMKSMGTYRKEYDPIIDVYSELKEQYIKLTTHFESNDFKDYEVLTSDGGSKKSPLVSTLESLRKDILQYSNILLLNPKAYQDINNDKKNTKGKKGTTALDRLLGGMQS